MKRYWMRELPLLLLTLLLALLSSLLTAGISLVLQRAIDTALAGEAAAFGQIFRFALVYVLLLCALSIAAGLSAKALSGRMIRQYRQDVFCGLLRRSPAQFRAEPAASYLSALSNDMKLVEENGISASLRVFEMAALLGAAVVLLLRLSPLVALLLMVSFLVILLIPALIGRMLEQRQAQHSQKMAQLTETAKELFGGYAVLRDFRRTQAAGDWFGTANQAESRARFQAAKLFALNEGVSDTLSVLSTLGVIFLSAYLVLRGDLTMGALLALVQLSGTFLSPLVLLLQELPKLQGVRPVLARLNDYAQTPEPPALAAPSFREEICLRDVSFSYTPEAPVLCGINLRLERGKKYVILGESGSGKSTLIDLLTTSLEGYGGSITYDGQELRTLDPQKIPVLTAVLRQEITLFRWTLGENIHLRETFSQEAMEQALADSGVDAFLTPERGLDAPVGEGGGFLSGGQRQRIALARALLRGTPFLILDEGTSALDGDTAAAIESRLLADPERTLLTIAHKLEPALALRYDEIYRLTRHGLEKLDPCRYTEGKD